MLCIDHSFFSGSSEESTLINETLRRPLSRKIKCFKVIAKVSGGTFPSNYSGPIARLKL